MLPDYLAPNLDIVFVGINPGEYSDRVGHYFARPQNLFWTALYESGLVPERLSPQDDARLLDFGYGLTDVVKRPSARADQVSPAEFLKGGRALRRKLEPLSLHLVAFVGLYGYRLAFDRQARLGAQETRWGNAGLFILPSTSPRNAYYRKDITEWFRKLRDHKGADHV